MKINQEHEHSFQMDLSTGKCRYQGCGRNIIEHGSEAQCEGCPNKGPCNIFNGMLLCESCERHDIELAEIQAKEKVEAIAKDNPRDNRITELTNLLGKEIPQDSRQYFVSEITSITDIEIKLVEAGQENPQYKLCELVEARISKLRAHLFEIKKLEVELKVDMITDQKYLNQMVPKLREEEREKFKAYDISYKPSAPIAAAKNPSGPRMSASERALENYAKMLGITVEQAKKAMASAIGNSISAKCTCSETPGVCKIHPKE